MLNQSTQFIRIQTRNAGVTATGCPIDVLMSVMGGLLRRDLERQYRDNSTGDMGGLLPSMGKPLAASKYCLHRLRHWHWQPYCLHLQQG